MKVNMHTSQTSAFISSTFVDLYKDRAAVADVLKARGLNVNALDINPASSQSSKEEIVNGIKESDFVVLIIGDRFGSILESMTGNKNLSITWWEYKTALMMGKPVIAYFKNVDIDDPKSHDDKSDPLYKKKRSMFERFKKEVTTRHNPSYYSDPNDLAEQLDKSLVRIYRAGVKELCSKNSQLHDKINQLEAELSVLKSKASPPTVSSNDNSMSGLGSLGCSLTQLKSETDKNVQSLLDSFSNRNT